MNIKEFSRKVNDDVGLDPSTIIMIVYTIVEIAVFLQKCKEDRKGILRTAKNPGPFDKLIVQSKVRRKIKGEAYNKYGKKIVDAIFRQGATLTEEELYAILTEAQDGS